MLFSSVDKLVQTSPKSGIPIVIPTFNNLSYLTKMIIQLDNHNLENLIILDNWSTAPGMSEALDAYSEVYTVVKKFTNDGPREYYQNEKLFNWLPQKFILTDPDIGFNENLPDNFVQILINTSEEHNLYKVGFALDIDMPHLNGDSNINSIKFNPVLSMYQWESQFWQNKIGETESGDPVYQAAIDTTFCLVNKNYFTPYHEPMMITDRCARVGGNFTAQHYGWYNNPPASKAELDYYLSRITNKWSFTSNAIKNAK